MITDCMVFCLLELVLLMRVIWHMWPLVLSCNFRCYYMLRNRIYRWDWWRFFKSSIDWSSKLWICTRGGELVACSVSRQVGLPLHTPYSSSFGSCYFLFNFASLTAWCTVLSRLKLDFSSSCFSSLGFLQGLFCRCRFLHFWFCFFFFSKGCLFPWLWKGRNGLISVPGMLVIPLIIFVLACSSMYRTQNCNTFTCLGRVSYLVCIWLILGSIMHNDAQNSLWKLPCIVNW